MAIQFKEISNIWQETLDYQYVLKMDVITII